MAEPRGRAKPLAMRASATEYMGHHTGASNSEALALSLTSLIAVIRADGGQFSRSSSKPLDKRSRLRVVF